MARRELFYIFHITREDTLHRLTGERQGMFVHPFRDRSQILRVLDKSSVRGLFGAEPDMAQMNELRAHLYDLLDGAVRQWMGDIRFIPRFIISSVAFLAVYFSLTLGIIASMYVGTALLLSLLIGLLCYLLMSRTDMRSDLALSRRIALRSRVDNIEFRESEFVHQIEQRLAELDSMEVDELLDALGSESHALGDDYPYEVSELYQYLRRMFGRYDLLDGIVERLATFPPRTFASRGTVATVEIESRKRKVASKKIDLPLYALYMELKMEITSNRRSL